MNVLRLFFVLILSGLGGVNHAAIISYSTVFTISNSNFTDINIGDQFQFAFSIDDSVVDTSDLGTATQQSGFFPNALTSASLMAVEGNMGSFDPSSVVFSSDIVTDDRNGGIIGSPISDSITFSIASDIPSGGSISISELLLNDMGVGQSFSEVSGGRLDQMSALTNITLLRLSLNTGLEVANGSASPITVVPIPAAFWLLGSSFIGLFYIFKKKKI